MSGVASSSAGSDSSTSGVSKSEDIAYRNMTFWKNGFQLEGGELRGYEDPANARILSAINAGNAPNSIFNVQSGQKVELKVTNRLDEECVVHETSNETASSTAEKPKI